MVRPLHIKNNATVSCWTRWQTEKRFHIPDGNFFARCTLHHYMIFWGEKFAIFKVQHFDMNNRWEWNFFFGLQFDRILNSIVGNETITPTASQTTAFNFSFVCRCPLNIFWALFLCNTINELLVGLFTAAIAVIQQHKTWSHTRFDPAKWKRSKATTQWPLLLWRILFHFSESVVLNCKNDPHWQLYSPPNTGNFCWKSFMAALITFVGSPISNISSWCKISPCLWSLDDWRDWEWLATEPIINYWRDLDRERPFRDSVSVKLVLRDRDMKPLMQMWTGMWSLPMVVVLSTEHVHWEARKGVAREILSRILNMIVYLAVDAKAKLYTLVNDKPRFTPGWFHL